MSQLRDRLIETVRSRGLIRLSEPVELASGALSSDFIDGKRALSRGADLRLACQALLELANELGADFDTVGGLTLGADPLAHTIAVLADCEWFVVRKAPKGRGTNRRIEGSDLGPGVGVLLVDDVVTTGGSIEEALRAVLETGATVVAAISLVDRGDLAAARFSRLEIPYSTLVSYRDLGIQPIRDAVTA